MDPEYGEVVTCERPVKQVYACCPFGYHVVKQTKLLEHMSSCTARTMEENRSLPRCHNNSSHVVASPDPRDVQQHSKRCLACLPPGTPVSPVIRDFRQSPCDLSVPWSRCRACLAVVFANEYACWCCRTLFPHLLSEDQYEVRDKIELGVVSAYDKQRRDLLLVPGDATAPSPHRQR